MQARHPALFVARLLPGWLASLAMALLFLGVWIAPEWFGWESMTGFQAAVFIEVLAVYGFLFMLAGRHGPDDWVSIVYVAAVMCAILAVAVDPLVALILPLHLVARVASLRGSHNTAASITKGVAGSAVLMAGCWLVLGTFPLPALGWTATATPPRLWWDVLGLAGPNRVPFALPAWAFLYFFCLAVAGLWGVFVRFVERTAHASTAGAA